MFGERYERFAALAGKEAFSLTGIEAILAHTANVNFQIKFHSNRVYRLELRY
jgi:hypothetical protein